MMQQLGEQNGDGQGTGQQGQAGAPRQAGRDPLGRSSDDGKGIDSNVAVPDEADSQRARDIMDAIRKKLEDPLRPFFERKYLERLLDNR